MPLAANTDALAGRVADEFNAVRAEMAALGGGGGGASLNTPSGSANILLGQPGPGSQQNSGLLTLGMVIVPVDLHFTSAAVEVTTPAAGSTLSIVIGTRSGSTWTKVFASSALDSSSGGVKAQANLDVSLSAGVYWVGALALGGSPQVTRLNGPPQGFAYPFMGSLTAGIDGPYVYANPVAAPVPATINLNDNTNAVQSALIRLGGVTYP